MSDIDERFDELDQELINHRGELVRRELNGLERSGTVLHSNYSVLMRHIEAFENNFKEMVKEDVNAEGAPHQNEFLRVFHNYLASVNAIYEHSQRVRKKFCKEFDHWKFDDAYYESLEKHDIKEKNIFLIDFRNYTQHYKLPLPTRRVLLDVTDRETGEFDELPQITYETETLRESSFDWRSDSKAIMEEFEDGHIVLKNLIEDFHGELQDFHDELYESASQIFEEELAERDLIVYKMHKLKPEEVELPDEKIKWVEDHFDL